MNSIFIQGTKRTPEAVAACLDAGLGTVSAGATWAVKLNLTYPRYLPGVVNSPVFVEGFCQWARDRRVKLVFVEGFGGNGSYSVDDTFNGNGLTEIIQRYGMSYASLTEGEWKWRETSVAGQTVRLPYSAFFEQRLFDRFVTAPLFKNHVFTYVTLGMKNLWGCIPDPYRMYYHHILDRGIVALYKELKPEISIFDGLVSLRGRGPMDGSPVDTNLIMISSNVPAGETAAMHLMGVSLDKVKHLQYAQAEGLYPALNELTWIGDPKQFVRNDFLISRTMVHEMSAVLMKSPSMMKLVYHSPLSKGIYVVVNALRGNSSAQAQLVKDKEAGKYNSVPRQK